MNGPAKIHIFDTDASRASSLEQRLRARGLQPTRANPGDVMRPGLSPAGGETAVVLVGEQSVGNDESELGPLLQRLVSENVACIVAGGSDQLRRNGGPLVEWVPPDASLDELVGKIGTLSRYAPLVRGLERELNTLHRLGEQLNRYFGEIDQEMRLAGRLQQDFLPRELPDVPPYRFDVFYRPASWVSGDMYDVFRVDEHHLGVFVADAMGHGVAAGLLTMFLRQALVPKRISGNHYDIVRPSEALDALHQCLLRQRLPNSQFVTAAYGIVDTRSGLLTIARAGHPYPIRVTAGAELCEIRSGGSLLGLADVPADFEEVQVQLDPGDKVILYTDGIEEVVIIPGQDVDDGAVFTDQFRRWATMPSADFCRAIGDHLDCREGSLHPADDATIVLLEVDEA